MLRWRAVRTSIVLRLLPPFSRITSVADHLRDQLQTTLGAGFTLGRELGGGGMSRVYLAHEDALGRDVVVKVLAPELAQGLSAERFAREIRLVAALQEPHIVPVHAAGVTAEGLPWYTMPYVRGESLRARLNEGPVPLAEAVSILRDMARALAYAHREGVVHRDIKPENVLLHEGTAVVTDFGIAKALSVAKTQAPDGPAGGSFTGALTQLGTSLGTPGYMAPEQVAGDPATDHRADLYAWGVVAYELLAGRHPFAGKTSPQQLMAAHFSETPAPLSTPPVPPTLAALVAACLAKDPADRPATAAVVLAKLDGVTTSGDQAWTTARPAQVPNHAQPSGRSRRRTLLTGGGVLALVVVGAALFARGRPSVKPGASSGVGATEAAAPVRVAVAPFENRSGDAALGQLAVLAQDQIARRLAEARVAPMLRGMESLSGAQALARARELGATYLVAGSLFRVGDRVQARADLVDVASGEVRRSIGPESAAATDGARAIALLQERVAGTLALVLDPGLDDAIPPAAAQTPTYAALREFAAGEALHKQSQWERTAESYVAAYRLDSTFTFAAVRLARAYYNRGRCDLADSVSQTFARRDRLSEYERAVLDRTTARCRGAWTSAYADAKHMAELAPTSSDARVTVGVTALYLYRADETLRILRSTLHSGGGVPLTYSYIAIALHMLGRFDEERALGDQIEREFPGNTSSFESRLRSAAARGDTATATRIVEQLTSLPIGTDVKVSEYVLQAGANQLYRHGHTAAQRRAFELLVRRFESTPSDRRTVVDWDGASQAYTGLARWDAALGAADTLEAHGDTATRAAVRGIAAARMGRVAEAERHKQALLALTGPYRRGKPTLQAARIAGALGQKEEALRLLQRSLLNGQHSVDGFIDAYPEFDLLWGDPRFETLFRPRT